MCVRYSGLPARFIGAFKKLYFRNVHFLRFMGDVFRAYVNVSGVKTGGPASGPIFVLCIDPFLHLLRSHCSPQDFGRAFADDIGYVIMDIRITLPGFAKCFDQFGAVSNIKLKIKKTAVVPLWTSDLERASQVIFETVPSWTGVKVEFSAKYLGMQLGPEIADKVGRIP
jgi:hypothetical protein